MPKVDIEGGVAFECADGDTILRAALREGLGFPYACNVGSCGNCRFELISGAYDHVRPDPPAWTDRDRLRGRWLGMPGPPTPGLPDQRSPRARQRASPSTGVEAWTTRGGPSDHARHLRVRVRVGGTPPVRARAICTDRARRSERREALLHVQPSGLGRMAIPDQARAGRGGHGDPLRRSSTR